MAIYSPEMPRTGPVWNIYNLDTPWTESVVDIYSADTLLTGTVAVILIVLTRSGQDKFGTFATLKQLTQPG